MEQGKRSASKTEIRKKCLWYRDAMEPDKWAEAGRIIKERVLLMERLKEAEVIFLYAAYKSEVPTKELIRELLASGKRVALPKVNGKRMDFYEITAWEELLPGYQGILEPKAHEATLMLPRESDVMLLPGAAFDNRGGRIGYGGGYYDRYLKELEAAGRKQPYLIGICYYRQLWKDGLPTEEWDKRMDCIITEKGAFSAMEENNEFESKGYKDYIVRATAADGQIRAFAATTRNLTEQARQMHQTSPDATAALGRLLTAGAMMGSMMKGEQDLLTIQVRGDGPIGGITVTADSKARVKGYVNNPLVMLPANAEGKLDVGGAVGKGMLQVIRDIGLKEPYVGQVDLISGEIAEDLTCYFAVSEQVPSAVALGVLMNKDNTVRQAGGFILQLMPFADEEIITKLEQKLTEVTRISSLLDEGMTPEEILEYVLASFEPHMLEQVPCSYYCNCSKERVEKAIASIGKKDLQEMIEDGKTIEVGCNFCDKKYEFSVEELKHLMHGRA